MTTRQVLTIVCSVLLLFAFFFTCAAYAVHRAINGPGALTVQVSEKEPFGDRYCLRFPAGIANAVIRATILGSHGERDPLHHAREWAPAINAMAEEMRKYPEYPLIQIVDDDGDRVTVVNNRGQLRVEVRTPDADVDVTLPASTVDSILEGSLDF